MRSWLLRGLLFAVGMVVVRLVQGTLINMYETKAGLISIVLVVLFGIAAFVWGLFDGRAFTLTIAPPGLRSAARDLAQRFRTMVPRAAEADMIRDGVMLGASAGQLAWYFDEARGEQVPVLEPWPSEHLSFDEWDGHWYAMSRAARVRITPGDGRWVLHTPS